MLFLKKFKWYWKYFNKPQNSVLDKIPEKHLKIWEDDYRMIEMLPKNNKAFLEKEAQRISNFGKEHIDGIGFTDITPVQESDIKTQSLNIPLEELGNFFLSHNLARVRHIWRQGVGIIPLEKLPIAFGDWTFAVVLERSNDIVKHIWFSGHYRHSIPKQELLNVIYAISKKYGLGIVNWHSSEFTLCEDIGSTQEFVENCI